jgi:signal transduction histidine kinase
MHFGRLVRIGIVLDSVPFRLKVIGLVLGVTFVLGAISAVELRHDTYAALAEELDFRGSVIAAELASRAADDVATNDFYALYVLLDSVLTHNQDVSYVFITDANGDVAASTFKTGVPKELFEYRPDRVSVAESGPVISAISVGDQRVRDVRMPLYGGSASAEVRVGMSEARIEEAMETATGRLVGMTVLAGVIAALLGLLFTHLLTRPLNEIMEAMRRIAGGDLSFRLTPAVDSDMAFLARSFNEMAGDLETKTVKLLLNQERVESANRELMLLQRLGQGCMEAVPTQEYLKRCVDLCVEELRALGGWACVETGSTAPVCGCSGLTSCATAKTCIETCLLSCRLYAGTDGDVPDDCPMHSFVGDGRLTTSALKRIRMTHAVIPTHEGSGGVIALAHDREDFDPEMIGVLRAAAGQMGVVIENLLLHGDREARERRLTKLLSSTLEAQEKERSRVARELHDDIGQKLTYMKLGLKVLDETSRSFEENEALVASLRETVSESIDGVRRAIANLGPAPLDDLGLVPALERLLRDASSGFGFHGDFQAVGQLDHPVDSSVATAGYRIVQEALSNAGRHSGATRVSVVVRQSAEALDIVVEDNGNGFEVGAPVVCKETGAHIGLDGMRERCELVGGRLLVESTVGAGTTVHVRLPIAATRPVDEEAVAHA